MIEAPGRNVHLLRARVPFIGQRGAATIAKRPPRSRVSVIPLRSATLEAKAHSVHRDPGNRLRADRSPAIGAVAIGLVDGSLCSLEPNRATVASTGDGDLCHANYDSATASRLSRIGLSTFLSGVSC